MNAVVAVPVQFASINLHVEKGRHWSVVEHIILQAICATPRSAADLSKASDLPIRLVIEALIELMRAGWAEIRVSGAQMVFAATAGGEAAVKLDTLPPITRPLTRYNTKFAVEQVTGAVLRWRELAFVPDPSPRLDLPGIVKLPMARNLPPKSRIEIVAALLDDDESYRGSDASAAKPGQGYALVTFSGNRLIGLPRMAPEKLRSIIKEAGRPQGAPVSRKPAEEMRETPAGFDSPERPVSVLNGALVSGGEAHLSLRDELIAKAGSLIILHSTFVGLEAVDRLFPQLLAAARDRGVTTHLFYGKDDRMGLTGQTAAAVAHARQLIRAEKVGRFIRLHPFSTRSHAKLLVADDANGDFNAVVGSCNWLSTTFNLFEVSISLDDPQTVGSILHALSDMAYRATGRETGIAMDLAGMAVNLSRAPASKGKATARLVFGAEHARVLEMARDDASERILIGSHRIGASAETLSLIPTRAAVRDKGIEAVAYYGEPPEEAHLLPEATPDTIQFLERRDMHAKFAAWDKDDVLITSQNLLSADPTEPWSEIGIHVRSAGIADRLVERIEEHYGE